MTTTSKRYCIAVWFDYVDVNTGEKGTANFHFESPVAPEAFSAPGATFELVDTIEVPAP
jgi:hypothetical protein